MHCELHVKFIAHKFVARGRMDGIAYLCVESFSTGNPNHTQMKEERAGLVKGPTGVYEEAEPKADPHALMNYHAKFRAKAFKRELFSLWSLEVTIHHASDKVTCRIYIGSIHL